LRKRPRPEHHFADDIRLGHRAPGARIAAKRPIVAHHEIFAVAQFPIDRTARLESRRQIGILIKHGSLRIIRVDYGDGPIFNFYFFARQSNHPFDEKLRRIFGLAEHHHVIALQTAE